MGERDPSQESPDATPIPADDRARAPSATGVSEDEAGRQATVRVQALDEQQLSRPDPAVLLSFHRRVAARLLKDKAADRAFSELMRGLQELPIDGPYAVDVVEIARQAGTEIAAAAALEASLPRALPQHRAQVRRRLARLYRRMGRPGQARDHLLLALGEDPADVRARLMLIATALQESNWALAAEQLAVRVDEAARAGRGRSAARDALARARVLDERLGDPLSAASAYQHAAELARKAGEPATVFTARTLAARALAAGRAPAHAIEEALEALAQAGREARREAEAKAIAEEIGRSAGPGQAKTLAVLAEAALARGAHSEASALLKQAVEAAPADAALAARLESFFIGRGAWEDLSAHYRDRAAREKNPHARAELLHRLAELLEDELKDRAGAAEVYEEIVALTGDPAALGAQVRLLSASTDPGAVQGALDAVVRSAKAPRAKAQALVLRGEVHLAAKRTDQAAADFEAALALDADNLRALAGSAECKADRVVIERLARATAAIPRGAANRVTLLRRLARLLEWPLGEEKRARDAWGEILAECPTDAEAERRLIELTRQAGDREALVRLLRRRLAREPRGPEARQARHELAQVLERMGRDEEALEEWRMAARMEPGDAVALLALADRCESRQRLSEAAFALEGAAAATERGPERAALWKRLARLCSERLGDPARAAVCEDRARQMLAPSGLAASEALKPRKLARAPDVATGPEPKTDSIEVAEAPSEEIEIRTGDILATIPDDATPSEAAPVAPEPPPEPSPSPVSREPAAGARAGRPSARRPALAADGEAKAPRRRSTGEHARKSARRRTAEEPKALARLEEDPFDVPSYDLLAELYDRHHEPGRAALMEEIARALEGDPFAEPLAPRFTLNAADWTSLRHPHLRGAAGELFTIVGPAFCALDAVTPREAGVRRGFAMEESPGSRVTGEALLSAVRVLGMRAPEIGVGAVDSPPLRAINTEPPRILVGRSAIGKRLPIAQLRFFAGRALVTFKPEMLALRLLDVGRVEECLEALRQIIHEVRPLSADAKALARKIPEKAAERIEQLLETMGRRGASVDVLNEGARHTSNRAGLLVAGGVAPAIAALRAKRDSEDELAEMLRFAQTERYLSFRQRRSTTR